MEFKREIIINKPINEVWEILGNQYSEAYQWASGLSHSEGYGKPSIEGASCNNRACTTTQGLIKEEIKEFDPYNHVLTYEVIEGFPFFVDQGVNTWRLNALGQKTKVNIHLVIKTKGLVGSIMSPMMKLQMNKITTNALEDLKYYVEHGDPSPRKMKELARQAKKAA